MDGVAAMNELVGLVKRSKKSRLILNVDFEKAYDFSSWSFLYYMLLIDLGLMLNGRARLKLMCFLVILWFWLMVVQPKRIVFEGGGSKETP